MTHYRFLFLIILTLLIGSCGQQPESPKAFLYVGTFSERGSEGIYVFSFNPDSLVFSAADTLRTPLSPTFITLSATGERLYSVNRGGTAQVPEFGSVSTYSIDPTTGKASLISEISSLGNGPCHVSLTPDESHLLVAHYAGGSFSTFHLQPDGRPHPGGLTVQHSGRSIHPERQQKAHAHAMLPVPGRQSFAVADLGIDQIRFYDFQSGNVVNSNITPIQSAPGSGPRHFVFSPSGNRLYVAEELSSTVSVYEWYSDSDQYRLLERVSTLPGNFTGHNQVADIHFSPDGRFLYVSNRGHDSLAIFRVDEQTGQLHPAGFQSTLGHWPRNFFIDENGAFILVANERDDEIVVFMRNQQTGQLSDTGTRIPVPAPVCLRVLYQK